MVSNVLSMRSIESGELEMHVAEFDPRDVVEDLLQARARACARAIRWVVILSPRAAMLTLARNIARLQVVRLGCAQADTIVWSNMDEPLPAVVQVRSVAHSHSSVCVQCDCGCWR
jgi:hypothetical protein